MGDTTAQQWARMHFGDADLPDGRLRKRLLTICSAMAQQPDASIPQQQGSWSQTVAAYRLLHNERVSPQAIQRAAIERTRERCADRSMVLCLHDLTPLDPVHSMGETRLQQHTVLAVDGDEDGEIHGVLHQRWFDDPRPPRGERRTQRRKRWSRSQAWPEAVAAVGRPTGEARWIAVADREADDFQMFNACHEAGQGFVIRSQHNRRLDNGLALREMMAQQSAAGGSGRDVRERLTSGQGGDRSAAASSSIGAEGATSAIAGAICRCERGAAAQ